MKTKGKILRKHLNPDLYTSTKKGAKALGFWIELSMEEYKDQELQKAEAQRDELLELAKAIFHGLVTRDDLEERARELIKSIDND